MGYPDGAPSTVCLGDHSGPRERSQAHTAPQGRIHPPLPLRNDPIRNEGLGKLPDLGFLSLRNEGLNRPARQEPLTFKRRWNLRNEARVSAARNFLFGDSSIPYIIRNIFCLVKSYDFLLVGGVYVYSLNHR